MMDEEIWKELPEEVVEEVIARLPIVSFFRLRSISRKWNSLLHSPTFLQHWAEITKSQSQPWFYAKPVTLGATANSGAMYDPCSKKWHISNLPNLSPKTRLLDVSVEASAGGLLCCFDWRCKSIFVGNPVTQTWKAIEFLKPTASRGDLFGVGMILNQDAESRRGYQIVWVENHGEYRVYDSLNSSWGRPARFSLNVQLSLALGSHCRGPCTVSIGSAAYFLRSSPDGIVSYDALRGAWQQFLIPLPTNAYQNLYANCHSLAECGGRILLVGLARENSKMFVCVWELQREILMWTQVDRSPDSWCLEFSTTKSDLLFNCLGNKGLLMISLSADSDNWIFTYDAVSREWAKVAPPILPAHKTQELIWTGTVFFPSHFVSP